MLECRVKSLGDGVQIADEQVSGSAGWLSPPLNCLYAKQLDANYCHTETIFDGGGLSTRYQLTARLCTIGWYSIGATIARLEPSTLAGNA